MAAAQRAGGSLTLVALSALSAIGVGLVIAAFVLSRGGSTGLTPDLLFWLGFAVTLAPGAAYLATDRPSREVRLVLVLLLGLVMYSFKLLYSPSLFTMSDESVHLAAAQHVVATHKVFGSLAIKGAPIASGYPGLEAVTVAVHWLTGLSLFHSGLIIVGMARCVMMLALFLLAERVSRSPRAAALAALIYMANGNFLFWSAQFSYESLALPLLVAALACIAVRGEEPALRHRLGIVIVMLGAGITATHHVTSYMLLIALWSVALMSRRRAWRQYECVLLAVIVTVMVAFWFFVVAPGTGGYLWYTFHRALTGVVNTVTGSGARAPFQASNGALQTPLVARLVSFLGVVIVAVGIFVGAWSKRRMWIRQPGGVIIALAAVAFVALYPLRIAPTAWETANRAQEILFVGGAVLLGALAAALSRSFTRRIVVAGGVLVVIAGGVISGWPSPLLLPPPLRVKAGSQVLLPQGFAASRWAVERLGRSPTYIGDESTGRELGVDGAEATYLGSADDVPQLLHQTSLPKWQLQFLVRNKIDYLVLDRRKISADDLAGPFFPPAGSPDSGRGYYSHAVEEKFLALPGVSTVFDSGDITILDLRALHTPLEPCSSLGPVSKLANVSCVWQGRASTFATSGAAVTTPSWRIKELGVSSLRLKRSIQVTVVLQIQNIGAAMVELRGLNAALLTGGGRALHRSLTGQFRRDNLPADLALNQGESREGSISFVIPAGASARAVSTAGALTLHVLSRGLSAADENLPPAGNWAVFPAFAGRRTG